MALSKSFKSSLKIILMVLKNASSRLSGPIIYYQVTIPTSFNKEDVGLFTLQLTGPLQTGW